MYSIGVDIGGGHITACGYNHTTNELACEFLTYREVDTRASRAHIIQEWSIALETCRQKISEPVDGIGIAMPGPFDYYRGVSLIRGVEKLESLYRVDIRAALSESLRVAPDRIRFINDATAFSIAEARIGLACGHPRAVAITLGTGFGSSFLIDGKPVVQGDHVPEGGYLYNQSYKGELADNVFSSRGIAALYRARSGAVVANVKALCERVPHDAEAQATFEAFGQSLGEFLRPYLLGFSADILVVGGNIAHAFPFFGEALKQQLPGVEARVSRLGEQAAMIGGALLLDDAYFKTISSTVKQMSSS